MRKAASGMILEENGKWSASRGLMLGCAGLLLVVWIVVLVGIAAGWWTWDQFGGALSWGRELMFATVLPYMANRIGGGVGRIGEAMVKKREV